MNDNELVSFVLMHKANGTLPGELSRNDAERFQEAMRTVNLWLTTHTEQQGAALLAGAATDPARKVFHECTWRVATTGDMIRAKQDAGAWPPLTPEESALVLAYVTDLPHHGQPVSADDVAALRPFASERDAEGAS